MSTASAHLHRPQQYTVVLPSRLAEPRPSTQVYVRRRLLVGLVLLTVVFGVWFSAGSVLANRGGAPASTAAVRPAISYVVQPGDTLWSIAERFHGAGDQATYVDLLVRVNGGTIIQVGQTVTLP
jgi:LysM repeat protein